MKSNEITMENRQPPSYVDHLLQTYKTDLEKFDVEEIVGLIEELEGDFNYRCNSRHIGLLFFLTD